MSVIIYPPTIDWDWMKQRPQHLMEQFALDGHDVYYCNRTQSKKSVVRKISPHLHIVDNNREFIKKYIPKIIKEQKIIVWVTWPKQYAYIPQYFPDSIVFDFVDDIPRWTKDVSPMIKMADQVFVTATSLKKYMDSHFPNKKYKMIPNGCDLKHFQQFKDRKPEKPEELLNYKGPIVTYVGAWAPWVDKQLMKELAISIPDALITVVGPEFGMKYEEIAPNVKFLGHQPYDKLPAYLYYSNICLIPFKMNRTTLATNPIKMYEYLATGKPVVATNLPEVKDVPNVFIGQNTTSFIEQVKELLASSGQINDQLKVDEWLFSQSWQKRYVDIKSELQKNLIIE